MLKDILIVTGIFFSLWVLWYWTGGVERFERSNRGAFIKPLPPVGTGETYGEYPKLPGLQNATSSNY